MSSAPSSWAETVDLTRFRLRLLRDVFRLHGGGLRGLAVMARGLLRRILGRDAFGLDRREVRRFGPEDYREWLERNPEPEPPGSGGPVHLVLAIPASGWLDARGLLESARDLGPALRAVSLIPGPGDRLGEELCQDLAAEAERWLGEERPVRVGRLAEVEAPCLVVFRPGRLHAGGVRSMLAALAGTPGVLAVYADEDREADGLRDCPWFKPAYDADLLLQGGLLGSMVLLPREECEVGRRPLELDTLLGLAGAAEDRLVHVPSFSFSAAPPYTAPTPLSESHRRLAAYLGARQRSVSDSRWVSDGTRVELRHDPAPPDPDLEDAPDPPPPPSVSVVIPTRDRVDLLARCLESLEKRGGHPDTEVVVLDNDSEEPASRQFLAQVQADGRAIVVPAPGPFNFSSLCNLGAEASQGRVLVFLNNDTEVRSDGAIRELAYQADRSGVGAVGARLWYPDGTLQHGGLLLGILGLVGTAYPRWCEPGTAGPHPLELVRGVSALTGACLAIRRDRFGAVGGFDEVSFPVAFNDVDLCLRLRAAGLRNLVTPRADMLHVELASRAGEDSPAMRARFAVEAGRLRDRWGEALWADPSWNPCLGLDRGDGYPAFRARLRQARTGALPTEE
jgi:GT2 family glycosyltransferase